MRRGHNNGWLETDEKNPHLSQFMGINLGSDFTAEHEWGIKELNSILGIKNSDVIGIYRYKVGDINENTIDFIEGKDKAALVVQTRYSNEKLTIAKLSSELKLYGDDDMATAWDGSSFGILVKGEKNIKKLTRLYKALMNKDAAVWVGGSGVFRNGGLVIGIISSIPQANKDEMAAAHTDNKLLAEAAEKTGVKQKIDAINNKYAEDNPGYYEKPLGYYALSPAWKREGNDTVHPVIYWLNPAKQDRVNYGWFTVEQLEEWIEGKGPIPKTEAQQNKR